MITFDEQMAILEAYKARKDIKVYPIDEEWKGNILTKNEVVFDFCSYKYEIIREAPDNLYLHVGKSCVYDDNTRHLVSTDLTIGSEEYARVHDGNTFHTVISKADDYVRKIAPNFEDAEGFIKDQEDPLNFVIEKWVKIQ